MSSLFVTIGSSALAAALLAFAWAMQHRRWRSGCVDDSDDDAIVAIL